MERRSVSTRTHAHSRGSRGPAGSPGPKVFRSPKGAPGGRAGAGPKAATSTGAKGGTQGGPTSGAKGATKAGASATKAGAKASATKAGAKAKGGAKGGIKGGAKGGASGKGFAGLEELKRSMDSAKKAGPGRRRRSKGKKGTAGKNKPPTSPLTRRSRIPVALAAVFSALVLVTSFPLSTLLSQHRQLSAAAAQLNQIQSADRSLAQQNQQLNSPAEIGRLARQDYQMERPGQTLFDVLPASGSSLGAAGAPISGDPGYQPVVDPAKAPDMSPDPGFAVAAGAVSADRSSGQGASGAGSGQPGSTSDGVAAGSAGTPVPSSFWSRVANTLEFWK